MIHKCGQIGNNIFVLFYSYFFFSHLALMNCYKPKLYINKFMYLFITGSLNLQEQSVLIRAMSAYCKVHGQVSDKIKLMYCQGHGQVSDRIKLMLIFRVYPAGDSLKMNILCCTTIPIIIDIWLPIIV